MPSRANASLLHINIDSADKKLMPVSMPSRANASLLLTLDMFRNAWKSKGVNALTG